MNPQNTVMIACLAGFLSVLSVLPTFGQEASLEQRQPLELVFADFNRSAGSARNDAHHWWMVFTATRGVHDALLTQKIEWGISDELQISAFVNALHSSNHSGPTVTGLGDFEVGARYTWATVGSPFSRFRCGISYG
jgi:hypothetical protein